MKIAFVGHTYWEANNRQKVWAVAKESGFEIRLYVPDFWQGAMRAPAAYRPSPWDGSFQLVPLPVKSPGKIFDYTLAGLEKHLRDFAPDLIHLEAEPPSKLFSQVAAVKKNTPLTFFTWENMDFSHGFWADRREKNNLQLADGAVAGNSQAADLLRQKGFQKQIEVMAQLGVDLERFRKKDVSSLREKHNLKGFVIGYLGRFTRYKGLLVLLQAASKITEDFSLFLVGGGGELRDELPLRVTENNLTERTRIFGPIAVEEAPDYLNCFDALILPSITAPRWKEQFGHVLVEAMACGVPVIGSDSGAIPEVIGPAGLIARENDADSLAEQIQKIISDKTERSSLIEKGLLRAETFSHQAIAKKLIKFWQQFS